MRDRNIIILKTGESLAPVRARHGDFEDWIARHLGLKVEDLDVVNVYREESIPDIDRISGLVITGSPAMVSERASWSEASAAWVADLVRDDVIPVMGICYGHQLIAHGLGGEVGPNPNGREMGTVEVQFDSQAGVVTSRGATQELAPIFESGAHPGHMSHVESVLTLPTGARALARTELDPHSVIEFGPRQWGVQFHPEFDGPILEDYVEARRDILAEEGLEPDEMIAAIVETPVLSAVLTRFAAVVDASLE